jgi:hypothetical protein
MASETLIPPIQNYNLYARIKNIWSEFTAKNFYQIKYDKDYKFESAFW